MRTGKNFYGDTLFERNHRAYGYHPKCKKCLTLKEKKCDNIQYAAVGVKDFFCADYREE